MSEATKHNSKPSGKPIAARPEAAAPWRGAMGLSVAMILLLSVYYMLSGPGGPSAIGLWQDDAVYIATAKSLAEGSGYRHSEMPGSPWQTKYPILYPAILAGVMLVWRDYPANITALLAPGAICAAAFVVLGAWYVRKALGAPLWLMLAVGVLAALSPEILSLTQFTMSDLPYAFLSFAALLALDCKSARAAGPAARRTWLAIAGALIAMSILTRSLGLTLAVAAVATLLVRRRWTDAAILVGVVGLLCGPWWLWQSWAAAANGPMQTAPMSAYDVSYALWIPRNIADLLVVARQNLLLTIFGLGYYQFVLPRSWALAALVEWSAQTMLFHLLCYAIAAVVLIGLVSSMRRGLRTAHLYVIVYLGLVLAWPFEPYRFLTALTPLLIYFLLHGLTSVAVFAAGRMRRSAGAGRIVMVPAVVAFALLLVGYLSGDFQTLCGPAGQYCVARVYRSQPDMPDLQGWLRANTSTSDVIAASHTADLFLATGRKVCDCWPMIDPLMVSYGGDRNWRSFFAIEHDLQRSDRYEDIRRHLGDYYRQAGITFYVHDAEQPLAAQFLKFIGEHPQWFQPAYATPRGEFIVYRVHLPEGNDASRSSNDM